METTPQTTASKDAKQAWKPKNNKHLAKQNEQVEQA
jgi:hypothetical protein